MSDPVQGRACLSSLAFDEWLAGEADAASEALYAQHVAGCAACSLRREQLERKHASFLAQAPTLAAHARVARREPAPVRPTGSTASARTLKLVLAPAAAALLVAAIALLAWRPGLEPLAPGMEPPGGGAPDTRIKGAPQVGLYIKRGQQVTRGHSGARVSPGDVLRFTYTAERALDVALLGFDGSAARVYFPISDRASARLPAARDRAFDFAVELDARGGREHFYGVFCPARFELAPWLTALEAAAALPAATDCHIEHIELVKDGTP